MWFKKFKFNKKDKTDLKSLFKSLFPNVVKSHSNMAYTMKPSYKIPSPIPLSHLHGKVKMSPPNIDVIVKDVLDNMETIYSVLNNIPVINTNDSNHFKTASFSAGYAMMRGLRLTHPIITVS